VKVVHVTAPAANIAARVSARQEYGMPYEARPFYRFVPPGVTAPLVAGTARGVTAIRTDPRYADVEIIEIENPANPEQAVVARAFDPVEELARIQAAYPAREASSERETSSESRSTKKKPVAAKRGTRKNSGASSAKPKRTYTRKAAAVREATASGNQNSSSSNSD
jgi:hypothetical protein